jgi:predicted rRNA methylase YqxC with S4 and FtsJ domains
MAKQRADQMLVDRGMVESRARAQALILAGVVYTGDRRVAKAGEQLPEDAPLLLKGQDHPWVSRGGVKLAHALEHFGLDPAGRGARCRGLDRRFYRCAAHAWGREGLRRRCRAWTTGMEAAQ